MQERNAAYLAGFAGCIGRERTVAVACGVIQFHEYRSRMHELSLFTGAGGGLLGSHLLGWRPIGYVEVDDYCQRVIAARIRDGVLPDAPIFGDIRAFISDGYADSYSGLVDVVTAGFPCQPHSVAGKREGASDPRNMWPETIETIRSVRPQHVFLENVPGIKPYLPVVYCDLDRAGYCAHPPARVAAASVGAGHIRRRLWIYAHLDGEGELQPKRVNREIGEWLGHRCSTCVDVDANSVQPGRCEWQKRKEATLTRNLAEKGFSDAERREAVRELNRTASARASDWPIRRLPMCEAEPDVVRVVYGVPDAMDRVGALGNAQIPAVVRAAWDLLTD